MKLPISKRLEVCAEFVAAGDRVADIGCDHGYLGIYLIRNNVATSVIASDIRPMPLKSAINNAEIYGVSNKMEFYLSDGASKIPRDFSVLVCAGMGADTIISVLQEAPWLKSEQYRLILQCQSRTPLLRHFLSESGWYIEKERVLRDGRFLYTVIEAQWKPNFPKLTPGEWFLSPALFDNPAPELPEYFQYQLFRLERIVNGRKEQTDPLIITALAELHTLSDRPDLSWLTEVKYDFSQRCT